MRGKKRKVGRENDKQGKNALVKRIEDVLGNDAVRGDREE